MAAVALGSRSGALAAGSSLPGARSGAPEVAVAWGASDGDGGRWLFQERGWHRRRRAGCVGVESVEGAVQGEAEVVARRGQSSWCGWRHWLCSVGAMVAWTATACPVFSRLRHHGGEVGDGRAGHTSLSKFIDNDSKGILRCYLRLGVDGHVGGFGREGCSEFKLATVVLGMRGHGERFAHSLG